VVDLLNLGCLDAEMGQLSLECVALPALLHDMIAAPNPLVHVKLTLNTEAADIPPMRTHTQRVREIAMNLMSNAVKFTDRRRGEGHGRARRAVQHRSARHRHGIVIAWADVERAFEEFIEVSATRGGTGAGLAISHRIDRLLGDDSAGCSTPGEGSRFTLTLPTRAGSSKPPIRPDRYHRAIPPGRDALKIASHVLRRPACVPQSHPRRQP
jgi:signal transduction histidine kinase